MVQTWICKCHTSVVLLVILNNPLMRPLVAHFTIGLKIQLDSSTKVPVRPPPFCSAELLMGNGFDPVVVMLSTEAVVQYFAFLLKSFFQVTEKTPFSQFDSNLRMEITS